MLTEKDKEQKVIIGMFVDDLSNIYKSIFKLM
jgi:hypothetical protein